jgi:hypothetical protein
MPLQSWISTWLWKIFQRLSCLHLTLKNGGKMSRRSTSFASSSQRSKCLETNLGSSRHEGRRPLNECSTSLPFASFLYYIHYSPIFNADNRAWRIFYNLNLFVSCRYFYHVLPMGVIDQLPPSLGFGAILKWKSTMFHKELLKDWNSLHLVNCGWYLNCLKDNTLA